MQSVSSTFSGSVNGNANRPQTGVLISWDKTTATGINYFTIGTSTIGGSDIIKSAGASPVFSDQYNYKDYSKYVMDWQITKNLGQYPYGVIMSQAQINLNNATGIFTPASGSAIGMNVKTGRPIKISVGFNNEYIYQFVGYTDTPQYMAGANQVSLHCYDAVDYLNSTVSQLPTQLNQKGDAIISLLLEEAGFATNQFVVEQSLQPAIAVFSGQGQTIGTLIQNICEAEAALFFCDELGVLHFWNREHFANTVSPAYTFNYSNTADFTDQDTPIINYVDISSTPLVLSTNQSVYSSTTPQVIAGIGPNSTNNIANPSFEVSTSGWSGSLSRSATAAKIGLYSASGTNMVYDLSSVVAPSSDGTGQYASAQAYIKSASGTSVTMTVSGVAVSGASVVGNPSTTVAGDGTWKNVSVYGNHFGRSNTGPIGGWFNTLSQRELQAATASCAVNSYLYVIGGEDIYGNILADVNYAETGNPGITRWLPTTPLPQALSAASAASSGNNIYLTGGVYTSSGSTLVTNVVYHGVVQSNGSIPSWSRINASPAQNYHHSATVYNGHLYIAGGLGYSGSSSYEVLPNVSHAAINGDGTIGAWSATTPLPTATAVGNLVAYKGYMYRLGGVTDLNYTPTASVLVAPINADGSIGSWSATTSIPQAVWGGSAQAYNGFMYIVGGATSTYYLNTLYYAAINSNGTLGSWNTTTNFTQPRAQAATLIANNYMYISGGYYQPTGATYHTFLDDSQYALFTSSGVSLRFSGASPFNLDAVSTDITLPYFDGDSGDTTLTQYDWVGTAGLSRSTAISLPQTYTFQVSFSAPITSLDTPVPNAVSGSSYTANSKADGTGVDMTSYIVVESIDFGGTTGTVTFSNTSTSQAYITSLTLFGIPAVNGNTISQSYSDASSITNYKLNPANSGAILTISNPLIQSGDTAKGLAYSLVNNYSTPNRSLSTTNFAVPQLQFGDLVAFYNLKTAETHKLFVVGVDNSLSISSDKPAFTQKLTLEERKVAHYFTVGSSTIGGSDSIAP